jgi:hypothetical protein
MVCHRTGGAWGFITDGYINAFRDRGHKVERWDGNQSSWYDFKPDLYIGCSGHRQPIPHKRSTKIAIQVNPYGPVKIKDINENDEAIRWVLNQNPDAVFGYGQVDDEVIWSYWHKRHNIPWIPMPNAGDRVIFKPSASPKKHDIVYLGGKWSYKALTIDSYLIPTLRACGNYKLHGWGEWPPDITSGELSDDQVSDFLASGKVGPCMSERHTHEHGIDIPERAFKVALCGTLIVHDPVPVIKKMIPSAVVASNPENYKDLCLHYANDKHESERNAIIKAQQQEVLSAHTYHHRMSNLLDVLGFKDESVHMLR